MVKALLKNEAIVASEGPRLSWPSPFEGPCWILAIIDGSALMVEPTLMVGLTRMVGATMMVKVLPELEALVAFEGL